MKLGFASAILPDLSFEELVDFASIHGFQCAEVMCWPQGKAERRYAGVTHIDMDALSQAEAARINDYIHSRKIEISALGYYPNPLDPDLEKREVYIAHIKKVIRGAALLGVSTVTTFIGRDPQKTVSENLSEFQKVWPDIIKLAEDAGVRVAIENCPMLFTADEWPGGKNLATTPKIWREMFGIIESRCFGLNYDPSHLLWQQMDYIKPIYEFKEKLFHVHIKDAKVYKDKLDDVGVMATPLEFCAPKIPGLGDIDWGRYISALTDIAYQGCVVIEVEDKAFEDSLASRKKAVIQSKTYINQFLF